MRALRVLTVAVLAAIAIIAARNTHAGPEATFSVSASTGTTEWIGGAGWGNLPAVSGDGRYVAFTGLSGVALRDRVTGQTEDLCLNSLGQPGNGGCWLEAPAISADGRFVAFKSHSTNLVPNDTNGIQDIFVRDRGTGLTERINVTNTGGQSGLFTESYVSGMSADGRYVAFHTNSNLDPGDANGQTDAYVRDRLSGTSIRVSWAPGGGPQSYTLAYDPNISADGRFVAFTSFVWHGPADTNLQPDIYVYDLQLGTHALISANPAGASANGRSEWNNSLSGDGRFVAFYSLASDLVPNDTNNAGDIFVRDRDTDADGIFDEPEAASTEIVSIDSAGVLSNGPSTMPSISDDGRFVTFRSEGTNLCQTIPTGCPTSSSTTE